MNWHKTPWSWPRGGILWSQFEKNSNVWSCSWVYLRRFPEWCISRRMGRVGEECCRTWGDCGLLCSGVRIMWRLRNWHKGDCGSPESLIHYIRPWENQWISTPSTLTSGLRFKMLLVRSLIFLNFVMRSLTSTLTSTATTISDDEPRHAELCWWFCHSSGIRRSYFDSCDSGECVSFLLQFSAS